MANYNVLVGIDYGDKRAEIGDVVSDIPSKSVAWLLSQGIVQLVEDSEQAKPSKSVTVIKKASESLEESGE